MINTTVTAKYHFNVFHDLPLPHTMSNPPSRKRTWNISPLRDGSWEPSARGPSPYTDGSPCLPVPLPGHPASSPDDTKQSTSSASPPPRHDRILSTWWGTPVSLVNSPASLQDESTENTPPSSQGSDSETPWHCDPTEPEYTSSSPSPDLRCAVCTGFIIPGPFDLRLDGTTIHRGCAKKGDVGGVLHWLEPNGVIV